MKLLNSLVPLLFLSAAVAVTAGAVYVSVQAGQQAGEPVAAAENEDVPAAQAEPVVAVVDQPAGQLQPVALVQGEPEELPAELLPQEIHQAREHNLIIDDNGLLKGQISSLKSGGSDLFPVEGIKVRIIRNGRPLGSTTTGEDGTFKIAGLSEGVASFIATSKTAIAIFGVRLVTQEAGVKGNDLDLVHVMAVTGDDLAIAKQIIWKNLPSADDNRFTGAVKEGEEESPHGDGGASTALSHHQVQLQADGTLNGSVNVMDYRTGRYCEVKDLSLHFISGGEYIATTKVNADGTFSVSGLSAGVYSVVSTGSDGIFAIAIDVIDSVANLPANSPYRFVSLPQAADFSASPTNPADLNQENAGDNTDGDLTPPPVVGTPAPPAGGAPAGGAPGGGSGGGAGGGNGAAALLGAATAGAIGYAVGDDDDDASPSN